MAPKAGIDLEAFGKAKSGSGSPSKERGDCEFCFFLLFEFRQSYFFVSIFKVIHFQRIFRSSLDGITVH